MEPFDLAELARLIDQARVERGLAWVALAGQVGVSVSTIRRFAVAADAEADGVLALIGWLGVPPEDFVVNASVAGAPLPSVEDGMIRVDMELVAALPSWPHRGRVGTRTTIQRLVAAAQSSNRTVASLTRWSAV
ncbi:MAG: hypothetical protein ACRBK7_30225 [Acidimicrobiales bacterium]